MSMASGGDGGGGDGSSSDDLDPTSPYNSTSAAAGNATAYIITLCRLLFESGNASAETEFNALNCSLYMDGGGGLGPIPMWIRLALLILYGIVCIVGLCGNTLVIYVVIRFSKMHTVTNLYIVNLAIADECFLVGLPFVMTTTALEYWPFGNFMCKMYLTTSGVNQVSSSMFLLIMSADRFIAVCHPISATKWRTPMISSFVTITAWALSAIIVLPIFIFGSTRNLGNQVMSCNIYWDEWMDDKTFIMYSFLITFAVPFTLISIFYVLVIFRLRHLGPKKLFIPPSSQQQQRTNNSATTACNNLSHEGCQHHQHGSGGGGGGTGSGGGKNSRAKDRKKSHRKVTKLVLTVITVYFLCWSPYWGLQLALASMANESTHSTPLLTIFLLAGCLSYSNSAMNPILYAFLSDNFKKSFMKACSCANQRDVNALLHGETSAGLPRIKSAERLRKRKSKAKLAAQQKKLKKGRGGASGGGGGGTCGEASVASLNGGLTPLAATPDDNDFELQQLQACPSGAGILLRPMSSLRGIGDGGGRAELEETETLPSPIMEDEDEAELFMGETDESDQDEDKVGPLIQLDDEEDDDETTTPPSKELFHLSPMNGGSIAANNCYLQQQQQQPKRRRPQTLGSGGAAHPSSLLPSQTFIKDGIHVTEL